MFKKPLSFFVLLIFLVFNSYSQDSLLINKKCFNKTNIFVGSTYVVGFTGLYFLWYKDYEFQNFHTFNDGGEWLYMDKLGHSYSSYYINKYTSKAYKHCGLSDSKSIVIGAGVSFLTMTTIEIFDGFSSGWGFSWNDMLANTIGIALYSGQELLWSEQRILLKFSYHQTKYAQYRPELLGSTFSERILKDYNGQTYWLSINPHSFFKKSKIPKWLNIAVGYGADGMIGGDENPVMDENGSAYPSFTRMSSTYLSFDIDWTKIPTKKKWLKTTFDVLNMIKVPLPTISFSNNGQVKGYWFYF